MFLSLGVLADLFSDWLQQTGPGLNPIACLSLLTHIMGCVKVPVITCERAVHTRNSSTDGG